MKKLKKAIIAIVVVVIVLGILSISGIFDQTEDVQIVTESNLHKIIEVSRFLHMNVYIMIFVLLWMKMILRK